MRVIKSFFRQKETLLGITAAIAFQLIFVIVWLTGYDDVYERADQFKIGIINEDTVHDEKAKKEMKDKTLFKTKKFKELHEAKEELNERKINMLIHLLDKMTEHLEANENVRIY